MARPENLLVSAIILNKEKDELLKSGFSPEHMVTYQEEMRYILGRKKIPSRQLFLSKFPDFRLHRIEPGEVDELVKQCKLLKIKSDVTKLLRRNTLDLKSGKSPVKIAQDLEIEVRKINNKYESSGNLSVFKNSERIFEEYKARRKKIRTGEAIGIPYDIPHMDTYTGGMIDGELITIVARTGIGKTFFMCKQASSAVMKNKDVLFISLEMPPEQIRDRIATLVSYSLQDSKNINYNDILVNSDVNLGKVSFKKMKRLWRKVEKNIKGELYIPEIKGNFSISSAGRKVEELKPDLAFFDYFGLAVGAGDSGRIDNWSQAAEASHESKRIAMSNNIPFVLGAQLNRSGAQSPRIENIALTDAISQDSDKIFVLYTRSNKRRLIIDCQKFRGGMDGWKIITKWNVNYGEIKEIQFDSGEYGDDDDDD